MRSVEHNCALQRSRGLSVDRDREGEAMWTADVIRS